MSNNSGMRIINGIEVTYYKHFGYWHLVATGARTKFDCQLYTLAEALHAFTSDE